MDCLDGLTVTIVCLNQRASFSGRCEEEKEESVQLTNTNMVRHNIFLRICFGVQVGSKLALKWAKYV